MTWVLISTNSTSGPSRKRLSLDHRSCLSADSFTEDESSISIYVTPRVLALHANFPSGTCWHPAPAQLLLGKRHLPALRACGSKPAISSYANELCKCTRSEIFSSFFFISPPIHWRWFIFIVVIIAGVLQRWHVRSEKLNHHERGISYGGTTDARFLRWKIWCVVEISLQHAFLSFVFEKGDKGHFRP